MSAPFGNFAQMLSQLLKAVRPPERISVSQSATKYRYMREATHTGEWNNDIAPYLVEIMDEMESSDFTSLAFAGPARCGKSDVFFNWLGYSVKCDPGDTMVVHMTQSTARDWSQGDLRKFLRHSKKVGKMLLPGKQNMNVHDLRFMNGMRLLVKWPTITELSGKTMRRLWLMDHDRMPLDIDGEGAPFDLARKRTQTFGRHGMTVAESSPGFEVSNHRWMPSTAHEAPPTEGILSIYNRGDRRRWYWRCASDDCGKAFEGDFKLLKWDSKDPETGADYDDVEKAESVRMVCPYCSFEHCHDPDPANGQPGKVGLNLGGKWIKDGMRWEDDGSVSGRAFRSDTASFWLKGTAAAFVSWKELVLKYLKAMGDYERTGDTGSLKATVNTDQGLPFIPPALTGDRSPEDLKARAAQNKWGSQEQPVVPDGCRFLTATVDVQKHMFVVQVHGHGPAGDRYIVDRFSIRKSERIDEDGERYPVSPHAYAEDWHLLIDQVIEKTYLLNDDSGRRMRIKVVGCDSGGREGVTMNAYAFWRYLKDEHPSQYHRLFQLVKGNPNMAAPAQAITYPNSERRDRRAAARGEVPVLLINTNMLKDRLDGFLDRDDGQGHSIIVPHWMPDWFFSELTVEVKVPNKGWENPKKLRNEAWDLIVYDIGICLNGRHVGIERIDWDEPPSWAAEWDDNSLVFMPEEGLPFAAREQENKTFDMSALAKRLG